VQVFGSQAYPKMRFEALFRHGQDPVSWRLAEIFPPQGVINRQQTSLNAIVLLSNPNIEHFDHQGMAFTHQSCIMSRRCRQRQDRRQQNPRYAKRRHGLGAKAKSRRQDARERAESFACIIHPCGFAFEKCLSSFQNDVVVPEMQLRGFYNDRSHSIFLDTGN
jgi:hypothetical protein